MRCCTLTIIEAMSKSCVYRERVRVHENTKEKKNGFIRVTVGKCEMWSVHLYVYYPFIPILSTRQWNKGKQGTVSFFSFVASYSGGWEWEWWLPDPVPVSPPPQVPHWVRLQFLGPQHPVLQMWSLHRRLDLARRPPPERPFPYPTGLGITSSLQPHRCLELNC